MYKNEKNCKRKLYYDQIDNNDRITIQSKIRAKHIRYAEHFGYPICCQEAFSNFDNVIPVQKKIKEGFDKGFIPCDYCFQHKEKKEIYSLIQKKRKSIIPIHLNTQSLYNFKSLGGKSLAFKENI